MYLCVDSGDKAAAWKNCQRFMVEEFPRTLLTNIMLYSTLYYCTEILQSYSEKIDFGFFYC